MTDAPERIWLLPHDGEQRCWCDDPDPGGTGHGDEAAAYVRADLVEALEAALRPFGDAADHAIESIGKTTTLGVLGALAPYFVTWQDFNRARAALRSTREGG